MGEPGFWDQQERAARDTKHAENLTLLAQHCHLRADQVMDMLRSYMSIAIEWEESGEVLFDSSEFRDAPDGLTDPELAEWAVQQISN